MGILCGVYFFIMYLKFGGIWRPPPETLKSWLERKKCSSWWGCDTHRPELTTVLGHWKVGQRITYRCCLFLLETGSRYKGQAGIELRILLTEPWVLSLQDYAITTLTDFKNTNKQKLLWAYTKLCAKECWDGPSLWGWEIVVVFISGRGRRGCW